MKKLSIEYNSQKFEFQLIRSKRKTMQISIHSPDKIRVFSPEKLSNKKILEWVSSKGPWIEKQLKDYYDNYSVAENKNYVDGEKFLYLGRSYQITIILDSTLSTSNVKFSRGRIVITTPTKDPAVLRNAMEIWYRQKALEKISEKVFFYSKALEVKPSSITIKEQKSRWGSCSQKGDLFFNWRIIMAPSNVVDYIVVHELCHLIHFNHSPQFWDELSCIIPKYKEYRKWLKYNGALLDIEPKSVE